MKTKNIFITGLAVLLAVSSCTLNKYEKNGEIEKGKVLTLFSAKPCPPCERVCGEEPSVKEVKMEQPKAKIPKFKERKAKEAIDYEEKINGGYTECYDLKLGKFETNDAELEIYAALAQNGLVSIDNEAIMDSQENCSNWINVSLTDLGKKYVFKGEACDNTKMLEKSRFSSLFKPVLSKDQYGDAFEVRNENEKVNSLILDFYAQYAIDPVAAVEKYGENELFEAYVRMSKADSCAKALNIPSPMPENVFTGGQEIESVDSTIYRIPRYKNTYKVSFDKGNVLLILNESEDKIFDVVEKASENKTFKKTNASYGNDEISNLYSRVKALHNQKPSEKAKPEYYAPGLVARSWTATGLVKAERYGYVYDVVADSAQSYYVPVCLFNEKVDRIYKVTYYAAPADEDAFYSIPRYEAEATVVFKCVNLTPFQFVLQNYNMVWGINEGNVYRKENIIFRYYDDCGWAL